MTLILGSDGQPVDTGYMNRLSTVDRLTFYSLLEQGEHSLTWPSEETPHATHVVFDYRQ